MKARQYVANYFPCYSYKCECKDGYTTSVDGLTCEDINECLELNGNCSDICTNTAGSFECKCSSGSTLDSNGKMEMLLNL